MREPHASELFGLIVVAAAVAAFAMPGVARGDAVTDWNTNANAAIFATTPTAHAAVLSTAMVQAAVYDAVNAIAGGYQPYLVDNAPRRPALLTGRRCGDRCVPRRRALVLPQLADPADEVRRVTRSRYRTGLRRREGSRSAKRPPPRSWPRARTTGATPRRRSRSSSARPRECGASHRRRSPRTRRRGWAT